VVYPSTDFTGPRNFMVLMYGKEPYNRRLFDVVLIDSQSGAVQAAKALPFYLQLVVLAGPLHFGDYGAIALKIFWLLNAWLVLASMAQHICDVAFRLLAGVDKRSAGRQSCGDRGSQRAS
jgi:uncharacterized iron-regulated membrane protein